MSNSTITVQNVVDWARAYPKLAPVLGVGGFSLQPALSIANDVLAEIIAAPLNWKFNRRTVTPWATTKGQQDVGVTGAAAWALGPSPPAGGAPIALSPLGATQSGFTVTLNTTVPHGFSVGQAVNVAGVAVAAYNGIGTPGSGAFPITAVPSPISFQYTLGTSGLAASGAPGITDFNWIESATVQDASTTLTPPPEFIIEAVNYIEPTGDMGNPSKVCMLSDDGSGTLTFRTWPVPGSFVWLLNVVYQAKPPLLTALSNTWAPIPDELGRVVRSGFLALAMRHAGDARANEQYAMFRGQLMEALNSKDREPRNEGLYPWRGIQIG